MNIPPERSALILGWRRSLAIVWLKCALLFTVMKNWMGIVGAATFVTRTIRSTPGRIDDGRHEMAFD